MLHLNKVAKAKIIEDVFIRAKHIIFETYEILRGIDENQDIPALAYLPGFAAVRSPKITIALLTSNIAQLIFEFTIEIILSIVKPLEIRSTPARLLAYPIGVNHGLPTLVIILARSYITRDFLPVISKLLADINSSNPLQCVLFVSYYPESMQYIDKLISSTSSFKVHRVTEHTLEDRVENRFSNHNLWITLKYLVKLLAIPNKTSLISRLIAFNCILKTRLLSYNSFLQFDHENCLNWILDKENIYNDLHTAILLDPADHKTLFHGLALRKHQNTTLVSLQHGVYGIEALEWCSFPLSFHLVWSHHFKSILENLTSERFENPKILTYKDSRLEFSATVATNFSQKSYIEPVVLVIGSMNPWSGNNLLSIEQHIKTCAKNLGNLFRKLEEHIAIGVILRPHPLDRDLLNIITLTSCSTNFIQSSNELSEDLQRADFVIYLYPSAVLIHSIIRNIPSAILDMDLLPRWSTSWVPNSVLSLSSNELNDFVKFISQPLSNKLSRYEHKGDKVFSSENLLGFDSPELFHVLSSIDLARHFHRSPR